MAKLTDKEAVQQIKRQIDEIDSVRKKGRISPKFKSWQTRTSELLEKVFGRRSRQVNEFDGIPYSLAAFSNQTPESKFDEAFQQGLKNAAIMLSSLVKEVQKSGAGGEQAKSSGASSEVAGKVQKVTGEQAPRIEPPPPVTTSSSAASDVIAKISSAASTSNKVFVVFTEDNKFKTELTEFLTKIGLAPIMIQERSGEQERLFDMLEEHYNAGYAIVSLEPDAKSLTHDAVFKLGALVGALGRDHVCGLMNGNIDILANYSGISFAAIDPGGAWKFILIKKLKDAGYRVDANLAL